MKLHLKLNAETRKAWVNGKELNPKISQLVHNHSPDGFNWGYGGSGPAQLALSICIELGDDDVRHAIRKYQDFKWQVIARLPQGEDFDDEIEYDF